MTTTIINKATWESEYVGENHNGLYFTAMLWDCRKYVNTTKLRKTLNLKGRGKILYILTRNSNDPLFVNVANMDVEYKSPLAVEETMAGAYMMTTHGYRFCVSDHPIGNVVVVLAE